MINEKDILDAINTVLYNHDLISKEMYLKCSKPKYISGLPYDLRVNDPESLNTRLEAIESELDKRESILKNAERRIGVKTRDSERLSKRVEKSISDMDKNISSINDESDKVLKNITKVESKLTDASNTDVDNALEEFKKAHNNFYDKDLTEVDFEEYRKSWENYSDKNQRLVQILKDNGFPKTTINTVDASANLKRIKSNIDKYEKNGKKITSDVESIGNNQNDIDYITTQSRNVSKEIDILLDEYAKTHNKYVENGGSKKSQPNPQMILDLDAKQGDNFTLLPPNYDKYMIEG